jgi:HAD superfamily hydrolase (TIGR01509 family)
MGAPELVIFDCDGVLVDSEVISHDVLARALTAERLPTTLAQARRQYQGLLLSEVVQRAQRSLGRELAKDWVERFERDRAEAFRRELEAVPDAAGTVQRVKDAGIPLCVASQGSLEKTRMTLGLTGLLSLFPAHAMFSGQLVPRGKPHPDLFLHAAATMGATPSRCVVVEDTLSGVTAAVAAGMRAIGYAADSDETALRNAGAELLQTLAQLPEVLAI